MGDECGDYDSQGNERSLMNSEKQKKIKKWKRGKRDSPSLTRLPLKKRRIRTIDAKNEEGIYSFST